MASLVSFGQDLRIAFRILRKSAGASALSILSIALGIGLTAGMFSVGDAMLLRPLAIHQPDEVFRITSRGDDGRIFLYGWPDYLDMTAAADGAAEIAAYQRRSIFLTAGEESVNLPVSPVSPNYFSLLGRQAMLGRTTFDSPDGRPRAVLGYRTWQRRFGGASNLPGSTVLLNGKAFVVAGIMPEDLTGLSRGIPTEVWVGADAWFHTLGNRPEEESRGGQFEFVARLKPGVEPVSAAARLDTAIRGAGKHKASPAGTNGTLLSASFGSPWRSDLEFGGGLALSLALVLFVACANVAQLRLAQAESRRKEFGVRMALGAGGWRIVGQLLLETSIISVVGAVLGIALSQVLMEKAAEFLAAGNTAVDYGIRLDHRVLAFTLFALLLAVVLAGLAPARHAARVDVAGILKSEQGSTGARRGWQHQALVAGQVAVSVALIGAAGLFFDSLRNAAAVRPGIDPFKQMIVLEAGSPAARDSAAWSEQACAALAALPGVRNATFARRLPLSGSGGGLTTRVEIPGQAPVGVPLNNVAGNYFSVMGTRVLAGRGIEPTDRAGGGLVAVVSQSFARQILPGRHPLGESVRIGRKLRQVVGIAEDGPSNDLHETPQPYVWLPFSQAPAGDITLLVETAGAPEALSVAVREQLKRYDPRVDIYAGGTLKQQMDEALAQDRAMASAAGGLGIFGVVLTAAGLFGLLQFTVNRRTREFGLRMALGAAPVEIRRMVLRESLRIAAWGVPAGLILLALVGWSLRSRFLGITVLHPHAYLISGIAGAALTLISAWLPAVRATRVDPMAALRAD